MNKILMINPFGIGDVLFTTPVISNLKRAYPKAKITYIANRRVASFLNLNPKIDSVIVYERDEFVSLYRRNPFEFFEKWMGLIKGIKAQKFDAVFDFSMNSTFGFVTYLCAIPKRIGYDYRGRGRFLTHKFPLSAYEGKHVVEYHLDILKHLGLPAHDQHMEMPISPQDDQWAERWLIASGIAVDQSLIAVIPGGGQSWGASAKNKRWPAVKYADLVDKIIAESRGAVILMGDAGEAQLCQEVSQLIQHPVYSAVGQTTLMQMAALLKKCRLAIVNDGGPLHVAVASRVPTVSIFGPVDEAVYGPYPVEGHVVVKKGLACQPCYRRFRMAACTHISCLQSLSVEHVYRKVKEIL